MLLQGAEFDGKDTVEASQGDSTGRPRIDKDQHFARTSNGITTATTASAIAVRWMTLCKPGTFHDKAGKDRGGHGDVEAGDKEHAVTLSEERLKAGKERVEVGRVRLRKYTTTHTEKVDVPVTKKSS